MITFFVAGKYLFLSLSFTLILETTLAQFNLVPSGAALGAKSLT